MGLYLTTNEVNLLQGRKNLKVAQADLADIRRGGTGPFSQSDINMTGQRWAIAQAEHAVCVAIDKVAGYQRSVDSERIHREPTRQKHVEGLFGIPVTEPVWVTPRSFYRIRDAMEADHQPDDAATKLMAAWARATTSSVNGG